MSGQHETIWPSRTFCVSGGSMYGPCRAAELVRRLIVSMCHSFSTSSPLTRYRWCSSTYS